ncbi:NAD(P)-dependent oxidoreductase [Mycobacterium avium subsp. hominissuis]|nr:NAD(P)-dependent oxidoreductase [Mycobacterium avium subsp. hominissuis]
MKVLVTGATGPFGRAVCRRLVAAGHDVTAMGPYPAADSRRRRRLHGRRRP